MSYNVHIDNIQTLMNGLATDSQSRLGQLIDVVSGKANIGILDSRAESRLNPRQQVVILAGGCDSSVEERVQEYRPVLLHGLMHFDGVMLSGGTSSGVSGLAGEVAASLSERGRRKFILTGYLPASLPKNANRHTGYDRFVTTDSEMFSQLEPIQMWTDLIASGIEPERVRVLGINGGGITTFELQLALALGAHVAVLVNSGKASQEIIEDPIWGSSPRLIAIPSDAGTVWAFTDTRQLGESEVADSSLEKVAQAIHENYVRCNAHKAPDPSLVSWDQLDRSLRDSNRDQARKAAQLLMTAGYAIAPMQVSSLVWKDFTNEDIEEMAEMEHGRWNVERLTAGWRLGKRNPVAKTSPYLVAWKELPEEIKEYDRQAIRALPDVLKQARMSIRKTGCLLGMRLEILEYAGQRQDGHIYHAKNPHMDHEYYVKEIVTANLQDTEILREGMKNLGILIDCPDIENYLAFAHNSRYYICTEWFQKDLVSLLDETRHLTEDAFWLSVLEPMLGYVRALAFAHKKSVIHGNVSSRYLYLRKNGPRLIENEPQYSGVLAGFGPAARPSMHERLRKIGVGAGAVGYLSPEQAQNGLVGLSPQTDIWGIGACLYRLITGKTLHDTTESNEYEKEEDAALDMVRNKLVSVSSIDLSGLQTISALQVQEIVEKCLQKNPSDRYPDADTLYEAIDNAIVFARGQGNIEGRLWPPYVSSWFTDPANEENASHNWNDQEDKNKRLARTYLLRLLGYQPPDHWFDDVSQYERLHDVLKSLIGGHSLAQSLYPEKMARPPFLGSVILLLGAALGTEHRDLTDDFKWSENLLKKPLLSYKATNRDVRSALSDLFSLFKIVSRHRVWPDRSAVVGVRVQDDFLAIELAFPYRDWQSALTYERRGNLFSAIHRFKERFVESKLTKWVPNIDEAPGNGDHCVLKFSNI